MVFLYIIVAGLLMAINNLSIRATMGLSESKGQDPFLAWRFLAAGVVSFLIPYAQNGAFVFHSTMLTLGVFTGIVLRQLQAALEESLKYGPAAKSFIFAGGSSVVPALVMFLVFGEEFGYGYSIQSGFGMLLVVSGLVWMCQGDKKQGKGTKSSPKKWLKWALISFALSALYQLIFQWRALLFREGLPESVLVPFRCSLAEGDCFLLAMLVTAGVYEAVAKNAVSLARKFTKQQIGFYSVIGGGFMGLSMFSLMQATQFASTEVEKLLVFPLYCVTLIVGCGLWGKVLYKEKVKWPANALCVVGIFVSSL